MKNTTSKVLFSTQPYKNNEVKIITFINKSFFLYPSFNFFSYRTYLVFFQNKMLRFKNKIKTRKKEECLSS